jgi:hypothetical protein
MGCLAAKWLLPCVVAASLAAQQQEDLAVVRGRAVDRDGKPVEGCAVGVFAKDEAFDTAALLAKPLATTDGAGRYQVDSKRSADQIIVVATKSCQVCVLQLERDPGAERRVIDALMLPGGKLSGRVRDAAGKPLTGAWVRVDDPLPTTYGDEPKMSFRSGARTDERGIFEVLGVPRTGLRVTARARGYPGVSRIAAHDTPLDLTLAPTGLVRGRVVDMAGKPVPGMSVALVMLERRDGDEDVRSDGEGRFTITAPNAFRFRLTAYDGAGRYFASELLRGPADDVDVKQIDSRLDVRRITVRCVDAATRAAIEDFHASLGRSFGGIAEAVLNHPERRQPFRGEATFEVAAQQEGHVFVVVDAKGYGFARVEVPEEGNGPLIAELPAECVLTGRVIDPQTGRAVAGCAVRVLPDAKWHMLGLGPDPWRFGAISDEEGHYRIAGLAPGSYWVQAYGADRPSSCSAPVTIAAGANAPLDVELEAPRFLELELKGEVPEACLGWIWLDACPFTDGKQRGTAVHRWLPLPQPVPLRGPRKRKLGPVDDRQFTAKLLLPTRDRLSSALTIGLGVLDGNGVTTLQLPDLRTVMHRGRVLLPADVPPERVAVIANRRFEEGEGDGWSRALSIRDRAFAACLGSDARFTLDVPHGRYVLQLVDLETGIVFHTDGEERTLDAGTADRTIEIAPAIRWLTIDLVPAEPGVPVVVQSIRLHADRPDEGLRAFVGLTGGDPIHQYMLVPCAPSTPHLRWLVPAAELRLEAVQAFGLLLSPPSYESKVVATARIGADAREPQIRFEIPAPPDSVR